MAQRKVVWTQTADRQLLYILEYWADRNKSSSFSLKLLDKIEDNIQGIVINPLRCPESVRPGIRVAAMNHFSIFYRITTTRIIISAFWDNRQDPKKLLEVLTKNDT